jgi:hypothetical protein
MGAGARDYPQKMSKWLRNSREVALGELPRERASRWPSFLEGRISGASGGTFHTTAATPPSGLRSVDATTLGARKPGWAAVLSNDAAPFPVARQSVTRSLAVSQDFDLVRAFWSRAIAAASPWSRQIEVAHSPQPKFLCSRVAVVPVPLGPLSDILPVQAPPSR